MFPLALSAGLAAASEIPNIYRFIIADKQQKLADQYAKTQRPTYQIPQAQLEATDIARNAFLNKQLPGQSVMEDKLSGITANTANKAMQIGNPNESLALLAAANQNQNDAQNLLNVKAAEYNDVNRNAFTNQLNRLSGYQDQAFDYNKNQPYQSAMKASSALKEGAIRNTEAGLTGTAGVFNQFATGINGAENPQISPRFQDWINNVQYGRPQHLQQFGSPNLNYEQIQAPERSFNFGDGSQGLPSGHNAPEQGMYDPNTGRFLGIDPRMYFNLR